MFLKYLMVSCTALTLCFGVAPTALAAGGKASEKTKTSKVSKSKRIKQASLKKKAVKAAAIPDFDSLGLPNVKSASVLVQDQSSGEVLFERNSDAVVPIASITKLMTAMVALDARPSLDEVIAVSEEDIDQLKGTRSRLAVGTHLKREEMLHLALMSSENRAASALSRHYAGGRPAFIAAMNRKARELGLVDTEFFDSTGLDPHNVSSARDLAKMVAASSHYPLIREFSTTRDGSFAVNGKTLRYNNTNALVSSSDWEIGLQKTGFTNEAGKCLVMQAWLNQKPVVIVLLDSWGKLTRIGDANRIRRWVEQLALHGASEG
ncbi:MAG: D-alanyl-D-alanine endopeptidase [Gammaproteobacteria bacterium]|jgi:serine-type D-Ala-D-Ala endopeptidase (penicillin-binding protein 7)|nr:D-alanyl-D-alanine endopeptidase [Gammaproteobacteria bacterium]MBU0771919.1 D-alanyl-D-alanine endopeptidase [Gammaproteobacteria bacterium]MBU0855504.1 D-alanyl-D-alanine endopeptidase [Gammaproteobacteria bacterium]MBU1845680.1 D-alanyl-D-alanine endopeptidase [Gammaproteobacteria bacterium]